MKTLFLFLTTIATLTLGPLANAQGIAQEPPLVSTTGTAEIKVVPDLADLMFEIETRHADLAAARKAQAERVAKVLAALRAAGVEEKDLQTADIDIAPNYTESRRDSTETTKVRFYAVSQSISVTLHDVKKVPDTIAAAMSAGATGMRNLGLRTSELRKHRDAARAQAIKAAKEKAVALSGELGAKVGKPYKISETQGGMGQGALFGLQNTNSYAPGNIGINAIDERISGQNGESTFAVGTISISASVSVSFLLE
jgi:hypothetical protein